MKKINFQIEVSRVLEILSNDIYDSPYALLRENVQNAYDAVLMRIASDQDNVFTPKINLSIEGKNISISDNGIGMDESVFQNNFWKAGSSGKNNETAKKAGVVGTFGIGAMANFGVSKSMRVTSRKAGTDVTIETYAEREKLSVTEECIDSRILTENRPEPGTTIEVILDDIQNVNEAGAIQYLNPYIQYVQIPIYINGKLISQKNYNTYFDSNQENNQLTKSIELSSGILKCKLEYSLTKGGLIKLRASNVIYNNSILNGSIVLTQGTASIYGLRNYFGLAQLPLPNNFNFGGVVNLSNLHPTAGREALSRDSINIVSQILNVIETKICEEIHMNPIVDNNPMFLNYIVNRNRYDLAGEIKIEQKPDNIMLPLKDVSKEINGKKVFYYGGRDPQTILAFGNENSYLLNISQSNPRRRIQSQLLNQKGIEEVPDKPHIIELIDRSSMSLAEVSLILRITSILSDDYLLANNKVALAKISHQVPSLIEQDGETIKVFISRESSAIQQVLTSYETAYEIFGGFVKDFIRNHLYQKFSNFIPSSTRNGAEALHKILLKNKELFKYESTDFGELEALLSDYVSGDVEFPEVLKRSASIRRTHTQRVGQTQIGNAEQEIPSLTDNVSDESINTDVLIALPPIERTESETQKKILKTGKKYPHLNNFSMFLSLSDRVYKKQMDFFLEPHTTKIIWGMHRIVFIFTHASSNLSLYYDIELKERLTNDTTGGMPIPTTTILTKNKIFIPIIPELEEYFDIKVGGKEFFVRHDIITDFVKDKGGQ
jgi:molecular chaperone HtpG